MSVPGTLPFVSCLLVASCVGREPTSVASPATSSGVAAARTDGEPYVDVAESTSPIGLTPLFDASAPASYPARTAGDLGCLGGASATGDHQRDYASLASACGAPTGMREYVAPVTGRLHHRHDPEDEYSVYLPAGLCVRILAASDATMLDLDTVLVSPDGHPLGADATHGPLAIVESDLPVCTTVAGIYHVVVGMTGAGFGQHTFGIWVRPKRDEG
jgi:hypothetical protein